MIHIKNIIFFLFLLSCNSKTEKLNEKKTIINTEKDLITKKNLFIENELTNFFNIYKNSPITDSTNINTILNKRIPENILKRTNFRRIDKFHSKEIFYNYSLRISDSFMTVILTIKENDQEISSYLVNLNKSGKYIDYKIIAYDEIAEGLINIYSIINKNKITIVEQNFINEEVEIKKKHFDINEYGKIKNSY